ncbi:hypothetical protein Cni_G11239 [Canna indica]|uniref:Uncharacterized protein n=1 Tax=Canna indica TaxID=4628 RepID=A0AAQ3QBI3_9LILI|nr:hypothetical protein Cni_G11239 [Canna indica]
MSSSSSAPANLLVPFGWESPTYLDDATPTTTRPQGGFRVLCRAPRAPPSPATTAPPLAGIFFAIVDMSSLPFLLDKAKFYGELEAAIDVVERVCRLCVYVVITNLDFGSVIDLDAKKWPDAPSDDSSSYYKAITADSVLTKFENVRLSLEESLGRVEDIVLEAIGCQLTGIGNENA